MSGSRNLIHIIGIVCTEYLISGLLFGRKYPFLLSQLSLGSQFPSQNDADTK
jgi:hypothetical protein